MVRALASHQCGPGSNPGVHAICGLSLFLVLSFAPRGFSPGTPVFPSPQKPTFPNSNSTRNQVDEEPLCGCATSKSLFIYLFIYFLTSSSPFLVLVTSICGCRVCRDNQCDWSQYSQHLRNISGSGSVPLAIVGSLYVSGKLPTYPSPIVLV